MDARDAEHDEQLRFTATEQSVLRELTDRERTAAGPRLANSYRRLIELSRSDDPVDGILAAHLAREILSALPGALGIELARVRLQYENRVGDLAESWPREARATNPPAGTVTDLRRLLEDHERASGRAREGPRALLSQEDRARAGYVPDPSLDRWTELSGRGSGLAHRLRNLDRELPGADEIRRLADELTATLLAVIAPYFEGIRELDLLLAVEHPNADQARTVAALIRTASQYAYFFERADGRWLEPLAELGSFLTTPPSLVEVGGGYVQAPFWPQGQFLARVAGAHPHRVADLIERVPESENPRVVANIIEIARALPSDVGVRLTPSISRRMATPLAVEHAAIRAASLVRELVEAGFASAARDVLMSVVNATINSARDNEWHLEQILGEPLDAVAASGADVGGPLATCLRRLLRVMGPARHYSTIWLRNIDRRPRYGADGAWFVANALYRTLLVGPLASARSQATELLADRRRVLARVALAAIAERPELIGDADQILSEVARWDDAGSTRHEFRRSLAALWEKASEASREMLLEYAKDADEATQIVERLAAAQLEHDPDDVRQKWRSQLLYKIRDRLPPEWLEEHGPLEAIEDEGVPEITVERLVAPSPVDEEELARLGSEELVAFLRGSELSEEQPFGLSTAEGLGSTAAAVLLGRLDEMRTYGAAFAGLRPRLLAQVTSALERGLREGRIEHRQEAVSFVLDLAAEFLDRDGADGWRLQVKRDVTGTLAYAASENLLGESDSERALALLRLLIRDPDPDSTRESDVRDDAEGYDPGFVALNTLRGSAAGAIIELLLASGRADWEALVETTSATLREAVSADHSVSVRAAIGLRLPWLLGRDATHQGEWLDLLFGEDIPAPARRATWHGYLLYGRFFPDIAELLAGQYAAAVSALEARPQEERGRPRDEDEQLGIHVAMAYLLALPAEAQGHWLVEFYRRAAGWTRGRVTRWIAEQAVNPEVSGEIRRRARTFLTERAAGADPEVDSEELKAMSWISGSPDHEREVLDTIVLPALQKTRGATENAVGTAGLAARQSGANSLSAAQTIQLLVDGDPYHSLPHIAPAELRQALEVLVATDNHQAREIAEESIHTLGAQGFLDYRSLLSGGAPSSPEEPTDE